MIVNINEIKNMTAREYCKARRAKTFGNFKNPENKPAWRKLGSGYIGVTDGSAKQYVAPGAIFAIEVHDDTPEIYYYSKIAESTLATLRPYTYNSLNIMLKNSDLWKSHKITWDELVEMVKCRYPDAYIPRPAEFCAEYGMTYNDRTGEITNYVGVKND